MAIQPSSSKPWWRRLAFRLSVRALIVLVLATGGGLGWIVHRAEAQRKAVAAITRAGGKALYDWEWTDQATDPPTSRGQPWPKWLIDAVGVDYLADVVSVELIGGQGDKATDDLMVEVGRLERLKALSLNGCKSVTDDGLAPLRGLSRLRELDLGFGGIKGHGLAHLAGMSDLRELKLDHIPVTDADLAHLSGLTRLERLNLPYTAVTDAGLAHLGRMNLKWLRLDGCPITTAGLARLSGMSRLGTLTLNRTRVDSLAPLEGFTGLESLSIGDTPIEDRGLEHIRGLKGLALLDLNGSKVTDAGLIHLTGLPKLHTLSLTGTAITDTGLAHLGRLKGLELLFLEHTKITDAGLVHLEGLTRCRLVTVKGTAVTAEGAAALEKSAPNLSVAR